MGRDWETEARDVQSRQRQQRQDASLMILKTEITGFSVDLNNAGVTVKLVGCRLKGSQEKRHICKMEHDTCKETWVLRRTILIPVGKNG